MADRRKNQLAPAPVNNLYDPSDLYFWLKSEQSLPSWQKNLPDAYDAGGTYSRSKHEITAPGFKKGYEAEYGTLAHEMTHAAQKLFTAAVADLRARQRQGEKLNPKETQFLDAYRTFFVDLPGTIGQFNRSQYDEARQNQQRQVNALARNELEGSAEYRSYRSSPRELQAFGVGDTTPNPRGRAPTRGHLNPTMATEFELLRGLYDQLPETVRKAARPTPQPSPGAEVDYLNPFVR